MKHRDTSAVKPMCMLFGAPLGELPKAEGLPWTLVLETAKIQRKRANDSDDRTQKDDGT